jgi:hypothetical protein
MMVNSEFKGNLKEVVVPNLAYCSRILLEGLRQPRKSCQNSQNTPAEFRISHLLNVGENCYLLNERTRCLPRKIKLYRRDDLKYYNVAGCSLFLS